MARRIVWRDWRLWLAAAGVLLLAAFTGSVVWQASSARQQARDAWRENASIAFTTGILNSATPSGVEPIASTAAFRDFAVWRDRVWLSGPSGLFGYDRAGVLREQYRPGLELPGVELGPMAIGSAADSSGPELYIATHGEGLLAFDGRRFRQIRPVEPDHRDLTSVLVLSTGRVLLGTEKHGVLVWDGRTIKPLHALLAKQYVTALIGRESDIWVGTLAGGVWRLHAGQLDHFNAPDALPDPQVLSLTAAGDTVWAGTPLGIAEFRDGRHSRTLLDGFFARAVDSDGKTLRVGTEDEGVLEVPLATEVPRIGVRPEPEPLDGPVQRVRMVGDEALVLTEHGLFAQRRGAGWRPILQMPGAVLSDRNVSALAIGNDGRIWVGYFDHGLDILDAALEHVTHREDDRVFCINRIVPQPGGTRTAVATANGLVMFDATGRARQVLGHAQGLIADHVTDVLFRNNGMVVATPAGLSFVDATGIHSLYAFQGLVNNHVYALGDDGGRLLAGTLGGLSILQNGFVQTSYTTANSRLRHNWITALVKVGAEWFAGTYGAGVLRLDADGAWNTFPDQRGGFVVNPNAMAASATRVYAGSLDRGLYVYDRSTARWTNTRTGLPSPEVTALAVANGYLYVGTGNGLVRIAEADVR